MGSRGIQGRPGKTLGQMTIPVETHEKMWMLKRKWNCKMVDVLIRVVGAYPEKGQPNTYGDDDSVKIDQLQKVVERLTKLETQVVQATPPPDEFLLSELQDMSWPRLKVLAMRHNIHGVRNHKEAIKQLIELEIVKNDIGPPVRVYRCTNCGGEGHGKNKCPEPLAEPKIHMCLHCGRRDHREETCPVKGEEEGAEKQPVISPCEKCAGFHAGDCKMG